MSNVRDVNFTSLGGDHKTFEQQKTSLYSVLKIQLVMEMAPLYPHSKQSSSP